MIPLAFYAPLKSPRHPAPSGDRAMARLIWDALRLAGFAPELMSELRTHEPRGDAAAQAAIRDASRAEAERIVAELRDRPARLRPRLWLTYHVYYKAPDWIGPAVAEALQIPYAIAEGTRASKRAGGPWALAHEGAVAALDRAAAVLVLTDQDREALERDRPPGQRLVDFPPFLDIAGIAQVPPRPPGPPRLLAVAMMRPGDKLASYQILAGALLRLADEPWTLDIVGDGPCRGEVESLFEPLTSRVSFHGQIDDRAALSSLYAASDLLVWPAVNEAYGMALLEAQAAGCPVLAGAYGGVPSVVQDGVTGVLVPPGDEGVFAAALRALLHDAPRRAALGEAAAGFVRDERTLQPASARLRAALIPLMPASEAA